MTISTFSWMSSPGSPNTTAWRKWIQGIHDGLATAGMVQTSDTGQINIASSTIPSAGSWANYEIWRFDDALQATAPVFLRIEYGAGVYGSGAAGIRIQVGTSSDGAGVIGGDSLLPRVSINGASDMATSGSEYASYASGDGSSVNLVLWPTYAATAPLGGFALSRSCGADGSYNADALNISIFGYEGAFHVIGMGGTSGSVKSSKNNYAPILLPYSLNGVAASTGSTLSKDGTTAPVFPIPCAAPGVPPFVLNSLVAVHPGDAGATSVIQVALINGEERVYRAFPVIGYLSSYTARGNLALASSQTAISAVCYPAIAWAV